MQVMICPCCGHENIPGTDVCADCNTDLNDLDLPTAGTPLERSFMEDPISRLILRDPLTVSPETPIREVITKLVKTGSYCALVVSEKRITGILTERDILLKLADRYDQLADRPAEEFMTPDPVCLQPTHSLAFGLNRMTVGNCRHVPIEKDGEVLGVVSVRDVLGYLADEYSDIIAETAVE